MNLLPHYDHSSWTITGLIAFKLFLLQSLDGAEGLIVSYKSSAKNIRVTGFGGMLSVKHIRNFNGISPSLETFKSCLDMVLGNWLQVALLEQEAWTRCPPEVPSNLKQPVTL